jgi:putative FmdB family regulatory protein
MPLYEFQCLDCGVEFESLLIRSSEIPDVKCPACNSKKLEEKVSCFASVSKDGTSGTAKCTTGGG